MYYLKLNSLTIAKCKQYMKETICPFSFPITPMHVNSCATSLYLGNKTLINNHCNFQFITNALRSTLRQLNDTHFLVSNTSQLFLNCHNKNKTVNGCQFCLITIPCDCAITTKSTYLPPRISHCHHHDVDITYIHPINLALLQQFFSESTLSMVEAHSTFNDPLNISIPTFQIFKHNFSDLIAKDTKEHLSLKKMAMLTKANSQIYTNLADPLLDLPIESEQSISVSFIITIISSTLSVICLFGLIVLSLKYRRLAIITSVSQLPAKVQSANLPSFIYTTTLPSVNTTIQTIQKSDISLVNNPMLVTASLLFIVVLYKFLKLCFKKMGNSKLILEITDGNTSVQLPCMYLPTCVQHCEFSGQNCLTELDLKISYQSSLTVNYGDLLIKNRFSSQELSPISPIKLNFFQAYQIKRIIKNKFSMFIWIQQNNTCIPVNVNYVDNKIKNDTACMYPKLHEPLLDK
ncbi:uncharacterized protein LOC132713730 [Ruditapes philippinarum]|uniref:uncharacterized protein LOC132713730 n=1 Tax=Ruditapes philippinarum TaxID=129788 RepID=UPI00295B6ED9|nr:uncharacterized protein LOC132713730 [Ruditapes philippinarum]